MSFITMNGDANASMICGTNFKDSSKHNYLWIHTIFGRIYNSATLCRVSTLKVSVDSIGINYWTFRSPLLLVT